MPLPAQAGWRGAIRAEARRRRMKRIYGAVSAVAAVAVVAFCVTALLPGRQKADPAPETTGVEYAVLQSAPRAYVEADGLSEEAQLEASAAPVTFSSVCGRRGMSSPFSSHSPQTEQ